jgi:hypothetical protein
MARKRKVKSRVKHNPALKTSLKRRGKRLVHGYEIVSRVRKVKKAKKKTSKRKGRGKGKNTYSEARGWFG